MADEVALNLGGEAEGEGEDLGLYVVAEAVVVFNSPDSALAGHAEVEDLHNHEEAAAEARELGTDDDIVLVDLAKQATEQTFCVVLGAADSLLDPVVDMDGVFLAEAVDLEALVLDGLMVCRDADVAVNHRCFFAGKIGKGMGK